MTVAIVGYFLGALNILLTIILATRRTAIEKIDSLKTIIRDELRFCYSEGFIQEYQSEAERVSVGETRSRAERFARLHFALLNDYQGIYFINRLARRCLGICVSILIIVLVCIALSAMVLTKYYPDCYWGELVLVFIVPFFGFVSQLMLICFIEHRITWVNELAGRYLRKEYVS